jgi:hypothetical protein
LKPLRDNVDRADAGLVMLSGDLSKLTDMQQYEGAMVLGRIATGAGRLTQETIRHIVPNSIVGDAAKIGSWFLNEPLGQQQQAFASVIKRSLERERDAAMKKMHDAIRGNVGNYTQWIRNNPELAQLALTQHGLDPEDFPEIFGAGDNLGTSPLPPPARTPAPASAPPAPPPSAAPAAPAGGAQPKSDPLGIR